MTIRNVVFYNHFHNGDIFLAKAYMIRLIDTFRKYGITDFYLAHDKSKKLLLDIGVSHIGLNQIPVGQYHRVAFDQNKNLYINTWVGAHFGFFGKTQKHSSLTSINSMWVAIYNMIADMTGIRILGVEEPMNPIQGIPSTDWSFFDVAKASSFIEGKQNLVLFCNGPCASAQNMHSGIEIMEIAIQIAASKNPDHTFVCTHKFELRNNPNNNIFFTNDIFAEVENGDINEIAYLSRFCKLIVGKNSGPYMYCHTKDNVFREDCMFLSIGDRQSDCLLYGSYDFKCSHHTFVGKKEKNLTILIDSILSKNQYVILPQISVIDDEKIIPLNAPLDIRNY